MRKYQKHKINSYGKVMYSRNFKSDLILFVMIQLISLMGQLAEYLHSRVEKTEEEARGLRVARKKLAYFSKHYSKSSRRLSHGESRNLAKRAEDARYVFRITRLCTLVYSHQLSRCPAIEIRDTPSGESGTRSHMQAGIYSAFLFQNVLSNVLRY